MRRIVFTKNGACSVLGGFEPGTVARTSDALARHLVEEARVARYADEAPIPSTAKPKRTARRAKA